MNFIRFCVVFSLVCTLILSGCQASLFNLPAAEVREVSMDFLQYENYDLGIKFDYPTYYGEPQVSLYEGKTGKGYLINFIFGEMPDDPYVVYFSGTSSDFENNNKLERLNFMGGISVDEMCEKRMEFLNFVQFFGSECGFIDFSNSDLSGVNFNVAFLDSISNSVESVVLSNYPDGYDYNGLQIGFRVPLSYVDFSRLDSIETRGEKAVERLLKNLDSLKLPKSLVEELVVFRVVSESLEFIK